MPILTYEKLHFKLINFIIYDGKMTFVHQGWFTNIDPSNHNRILLQSTGPPMPIQR